MQCIELLLGNNLETNNETTSVTRQRPQDKQIYQSRYWVTPSQTKHVSTEIILATTTEGLCFLLVRAKMS
jgi:hypothetical protein